MLKRMGLDLIAVDDRDAFTGDKPCGAGSVAAMLKGAAQPGTRCRSGCGTSSIT